MSIVNYIEKGDLEKIKSLEPSVILRRLNFYFRLSSYYGHLDLVKYFYSIGAGICSNKNLALRWACGNHYPELVNYLLKKGADPKTENNYPIRSAVYHGDLETIYILVKNGADISKLKPNQKRYVILRKYYSRWRMFHWKKWFTSIIIPLYYSPGFPGGEKDKNAIRKIVEHI